MKKVDVQKSKEQQRWEGPYTISKFNKKEKSYTLVDETGKQLQKRIPGVLLKITEEEVQSSKDDIYEVQEIIRHWGAVGSQEYLVKWKGYDELTWVKAVDF